MPVRLTTAVFAGATLLLASVYWIALQAPAAGTYHDDGIYLVTARALAEGHGYRIMSLPTEPAQTKYPILFPWLVSLVWRVVPAFPQNLPWLRAVPLLSTVAWLWVTWHLLRRLGASGREAGVLTLVTAASPLTVFLSTAFMSETLFAALLTGSLLVLTNVSDRKGTLVEGLLAGLLAGAAVLTRTAGVAVVAGGLAWWAWKRDWKGGATYLAGVLAVALPWLWWVASNNVAAAVQERVAMDVAQRYLLTYTPTNQERDGLWRRVEVRAGDPALTVRTRDGYFASAPLPIKPTIEFTARDTLRRAVAVDASDLIVHEDGVEQTLSSFQEAVAPVSIVMALDKSGSMRREEEAVREAAGAFIDALRDQDALGVVGFADEAEILADIAAYRTWSRHAVNQYKTAGGTALYDAIDLSLERLEQKEGRTVLVLMTDGRDENNAGNGPGSQRTLEEVTERLAKSSVTVFAIGLGGNVDREMLERLAQMSGGEAYFPEDVATLRGYYERIIEDLRRRYVLGYTSTNSKHDGGWRNVVVQSRHEGLIISSRGGYQAPVK